MLTAPGGNVPGCVGSALLDEAGGTSETVNGLLDCHKWSFLHRMTILAPTIWPLVISYSGEHTLDDVLQRCS